jgi:hypothetical protein
LNLLPRCKSSAISITFARSKALTMAKPQGFLF